MSELFKDLTFTNNLEPGFVEWESPSNIAIVKYWGKFGVQMPSNSNLSFTLSKAKTRTLIEYKLSDTGRLNVAFSLSGHRIDVFENRIVTFLENINSYFPFLSGLDLKIQSENSFPHSSGIASSASGMSALALCLCSIAQDLTGRKWDDHTFRQRASFLARIGSGSASRSLYPNAAVWGALPDNNFSNEFAQGIDDIHSEFRNYRDSILIIHEGKKDVSSSVGHSLMNKSVYKKTRFQEANQNVQNLLSIIRTGDLDGFIDLCEAEALSLHGLMMLSKPPFILMLPQTVTAIKKVQHFRRTTKIPICFSLDAGPNLHVLYPNRFKDEVLPFINQDLAPLCQERRWLDDHMGSGPFLVNDSHINK